MMALVFAFARLTHLPSTLCFVVDFMDESCGEKSDVTHILSMAWRAVGLLEHFNPNARIVLCSLRSDYVPGVLRGHVSDAEYKELLQPLREFLSEVNAKRISTGVAGVLGLLFFPIGLPLLASVSRENGDSLEPAEVQRNVTQIVNQINRRLASRGISLKNPCTPQCQDTRSIIKQADYIMWVVRSC